MKPNNKNEFVQEEAYNKKAKKKPNPRHRSDHAHKYEDIVLDNLCARGFSTGSKYFAKRCSICGRIGHIDFFKEQAAIDKAIKKGVKVYEVADFCVKYC